MVRRPWARRPWLLYLAGLLAVGLLVTALARRFPWAVDRESEVQRLVYLLAWLALLGGGVAMVRLRPGKAALQVAIWAALILLLALGYGFRDELGQLRDRLAGALLPNQGRTAADGSVVFNRSSDGHFHVAAIVEGTRIDFLIDTGASGVLLSPADARRLGFDLASLDYSVWISTANGEGRAARTVLGSIKIGPIRRSDMPALVNEAAMDGSLLGMRFLDSLGGFAVEGDRLVLRP
jgi:aspartyl protease family protein